MTNVEYVFIQEEPQYNDFNILKESKYATSSVPRVKFEAVLQTFNEKNGNKRVYLPEVGKFIQETVTNMIAQDEPCLGELDHPDGDDVERLSKVSLKNAAFVLEKVEFNGKELIGIGTTTSNRAGQDLAALLLDGIKVGFSLRAFGPVEKKGDVAIVKPPVFFVAYDAVARPSHKGAKVIKLTESQMYKLLCNKDVCYLQAIKESLTTPSENMEFIEAENIDELVDKFFENI